MFKIFTVNKSKNWCKILEDKLNKISKEVEIITFTIKVLSDLEVLVIVEYDTA